MTKSIQIRRVQAWAVRAPITNPVVTSFGVMHDRPTVFVRIEDQDGTFGWGEVFANWPAAGAEHRVNLLGKDIIDLVFGFEIFEAHDLFYALTEKTRIRALQCAEPGPFQQVIAGLDIAVWDLFARRAGLPLRKFLNKNANDAVPIYASGIHMAAAPQMIEAARQAGFLNFKVKVGFDMDKDIQGAHEILNSLSEKETLAADANQAWNLEQSARFAQAFEANQLQWLEEPMPVFVPQSDWQALAQCSPIRLAGGENIVGFDDFETAISLGHLQVLQPDIMKWGGITGCAKVAEQIRTAQRRYCPHFLGGGIGLAASAELLAAAGGDGVLEVDANPNPLREAFPSTTERQVNHEWRCTLTEGLGINALPDELARMVTAEVDLTQK